MTSPEKEEVLLPGSQEKVSFNIEAIEFYIEKIGKIIVNIGTFERKMTMGEYLGKQMEEMKKVAGENASQEDMLNLLSMINSDGLTFSEKFSIENLQNRKDLTDETIKTKYEGVRNKLQGILEKNSKKELVEA